MNNQPKTKMIMVTMEVTDEIEPNVFHEGLCQALHQRNYDYIDVWNDLGAVKSVKVLGPAHVGMINGTFQINREYEVDPTACDEIVQATTGPDTKSIV